MRYRNPVYIIAEAGVNHNGSISMARQLIDVAVKAGANAVKFQTFNSGKLATQHAPMADYQNTNSFKQANQVDMLRNLELSADDHIELLNYASSKGIDFLSTPFDIESLTFLTKKLKIKKIKISSGDLTNAPFLLSAATQSDQIILSTGISTLSEVEAALGVLAYGFLHKKNSSKPMYKNHDFIEYSRTMSARKALKSKVTLLHCTSEYPAPFSEINLRAMQQMKDYFDCEIGYSDHSTGISVSIAAAALGATVIEKHFTLDRSFTGPDHQASIEPDELISLVRGVREVEVALGDGEKKPSASELKNIVSVRKSIVAITDIKIGEQFSTDNLGIKRPGGGIDPFEYWGMMGKPSSKNYSFDDLIDE